jgi:hypothetical protein
VRKVTLRTDERAAFVGKTGSGKSYLARHFLAPVRRLVVFDGKGDLDLNEWGLVPAGQKEQRSLKNGGNGRLYVPPQLDGDWSEWLTLVYGLGNVLLYIDEMYAVVEPGKRPHPLLAACYTRGRSRGIGVWASTQRPSWVPLIMFSEAEWFFIFRLTMADDRKKLAGFTGPDVEHPIKDRHGFFTYGVDWDDPQYTRIFAPNTPTARPNLKVVGGKG